MQGVPISERRGFEFSGLGRNTLAILMIKAPIQQVSPALAQSLHGTLEIDVLDKEYDLYLQRYHVLHQYCGHDWTVLCPFDICAKGTVSKISELLGTCCIYLQHEDTSGSSGYYLFDRGTCIEELDWGCDYTEEVWGIAPTELLQFVEEREAQGEPLPAGWDPRQWNVYCFSDLGSYKFRSNLRTATEAEVLDTDKFLNTLLCEQDAWLPDWEYLLWSWSKVVSTSRASAKDLIRVDLILGTASVNEALAMVDEYLQSMRANPSLERMDEEFGTEF